MSKPLRGVNLGGWLVLEKWITPSLFAGTDAVDEFTFCQNMTAVQRKTLKRHHEMFITEDDFIWLAQHGVEAVRLPIGHWLFGDVEPYIQTVQYVDNAFIWAKRYNLKILLDLHTAAGSQNGNDHSGRAGEIGWGTPETIKQTLAVLEKIAWHYGAQKALLGISVLNEPSKIINQDSLESFYRQAYGVVRKSCGARAWVVFSDSFMPSRWYHRLPPAEFPGLYIDYHHYQLFSVKDKRRSLNYQIWRARLALSFKLRRMARHHPLIIGEWSLGLDAAKIKKLGAKDLKKMAYKYGRAQLRAFKPAAAQFFWTYKTEDRKLWSLREAVTRRWLPKR